MLNIARESRDSTQLSCLRFIENRKEVDKTMRVLEKITRRSTDVLGWIAGIMILGMMLLAVLDVVLRVLFFAPIIGATEIIQILNVGIVLALGAGTVKNQHVTVDFVMDKAPKVPRFYIQLAVDVVNMAILVLMAACSFWFMKKSQAQGYTYSLLRIPEWPFVGLIAIGLLGGVIGVICNMFRQVLEFKAEKAVEKSREETEQ